MFAINWFTLKKIEEYGDKVNFWPLVIWSISTKLIFINEFYYKELLIVDINFLITKYVLWILLYFMLLNEVTFIWKIFALIYD